MPAPEANVSTRPPKRKSEGVAETTNSAKTMALAGAPGQPTVSAVAPASAAPPRADAADRAQAQVPLPGAAQQQSAAAMQPQLVLGQTVTAPTGGGGGGGVAASTATSTATTVVSAAAPAAAAAAAAAAAGAAPADAAAASAPATAVAGAAGSSGNNNVNNAVVKSEGQQAAAVGGGGAAAAAAATAASAATAPASTATTYAGTMSGAPAWAGLPHPLQQQPEPRVAVKVSRHQMHQLREALKGPDAQPLMARLNLRPSSVPFFSSLNFKFYLGDIGAPVTCLEYATQFNVQHGSRCLTILKNFDALSQCKWNAKAHALYSASDQASISALFGVCLLYTSPSPRDRG